MKIASEGCYNHIQILSGMAPILAKCSRKLASCLALQLRIVAAISKTARPNINLSIPIFLSFDIDHERTIALS